MWERQSTPTGVACISTRLLRGDHGFIAANEWCGEGECAGNIGCLRGLRGLMLTEGRLSVPRLKSSVLHCLTAT